MPFPAKNDFASPSGTFAKLSCELLNRGFQVPTDGWYQIVPIGEFPAIATTPQGPKEIIQVINADAVRDMAAAFTGELLVDYEHFSSDPSKETRAAGWITNLKAKPDGLYAIIRWSTQGQQDVIGGAYRFISPCFDDVIKITEERWVPTHLSGAGITNKPNMTTLAPLSNRKAGSGNPNNEPNKHMDYKELLLKVLGLATDASDEDIQKAADTPKTAEPEKAQEEIELLNKELQDLQAAFADHAMEGFQLENKEAQAVVRDAIIQNREKGLALLNSMKELSRKKEPASLMNRVKEPPKTQTTLTNASKEDELRAVKLRNRAAEISKSEQISFSAAWTRAESEMPA